MLPLVYPHGHFSGDSEFEKHSFWKDFAMSEIQGNQGRLLSEQVNANTVTNFIARDCFM